MAMRLTNAQVEWLAERVPDAPVNPKGGRPAMDKRQALRGIFWVLDNGAKWKDLPREFGAKSAVHKYFTMWVRSDVFENIMRDAGELVEERGRYRLYECFIDGTFNGQVENLLPHPPRERPALVCWLSFAFLKPRPRHARRGHWLIEHQVPGEAEFLSCSGAPTTSTSWCAR